MGFPALVLSLRVRGGGGRLDRPAPSGSDRPPPVGVPLSAPRPAAAALPLGVYRPCPLARPAAGQPPTPAPRLSSSQSGCCVGRPAPFKNVNCCHYLTRQFTTIHNVNVTLYIVNLQDYTHQMLKRFAPAPVKYYGGFPPPHNHLGRGCLLPASPPSPCCARAAPSGSDRPPPVGVPLSAPRPAAAALPLGGFALVRCRGLRRRGRTPRPPLAPHPPRAR